MGQSLNSCWWVGDKTLFKAPADGAFDHLNCQHIGYFNQNFSKRSKLMSAVCPEGREGGVWGWAWAVLELTKNII